jgi:hypothetical protein
MEVIMELIASTPFYSYHIDKAKNRMYVAYKGAWLKPSQVPDFVKQHGQAIGQLRPGFTILADWREMESVFITDVIEECQKQAVAAGVSKVARVNAKPTFKEIQAESMSQRTGIKSKAFYDIAEAEAWLDEA